MSLTIRRVLHIASLGALLLALATALTILGGMRFVFEDEGTRLFTFGLLSSVYLLTTSFVLKVVGLVGDVGDVAVSSFPGGSTPAPGAVALPGSQPAPREAVFRRAATLAGVASALFFLAAVGMRTGSVLGEPALRRAPVEVECLLLLAAVGLVYLCLHLALSLLARVARRGGVRGVSGLVGSLAGAPSIPPRRPED